jgi:hypothetical protein
MVYEVWQDGEVTLTKGGDLWRKRSLHMLVAGVNPSYAFPPELMPVRIGDNGSIIVEGYDKALEAHLLVVDEAREKHGEFLNIRPE